MNNTSKIGIIGLILMAVALSGCINSGNGDVNNPTIDLLDIAIEPTTSAQTSTEIDIEYPIEITLALFGDEYDMPESELILYKDGIVSMGYSGGHDESGEECDDVEYATWIYASQSKSECSYEVYDGDRLCLEMTIYNDGTATGTSLVGDDKSHGTWKPTSVPKSIPTKAKSVETPRPRSTVKPTPAPTSTESEFVMEYPIFITIEGTGTHIGVNSIVAIDDDGETCCQYIFCGMNIVDAIDIKMMDVTHKGDHIIYRGNFPDGMSITITAFETERGGGRATQIGFEAERDCVWNPVGNMQGIITDKIAAYN